MTLLTNSLKACLDARDIALCLSLRMARTVDIVTIAKTAGYDALYVDMEHSGISFDTTAQICIAALSAGITPLVRVVSHEAHDIGRVLDGGALGIIAPHVQNAEDAARVVDHARFPPLGSRSLAGPAVQLGYRNLPLADGMAILNSQTLVIAMIETAEAVAQAGPIAAVDGIDMLFVGTSDLCADLGIAGQFGHEKIRAAYAHLGKVCRDRGKHLGIGGIKNDIPLLTTYCALGARFISAGSDSGLLLNAATAQANLLRKIPAQPPA